MFRSMRQVGVVIVVVFMGACTVESTKPEAFEGGGFVVSESGTVALSDDVPQIDSANCPAGRVLARTASGWGCAEVGVNALAQAQLSCQVGDVVQLTASGWACMPVTSTTTVVETGAIRSVTAGPGLMTGGTEDEVELSVRFGGTGSVAIAARVDHVHEVEDEVERARATYASLAERLSALESRRTVGLCPDDYVPTGTTTARVLCVRGNDQMVGVGDGWIDRYEATVVEEPTWNQGNCDGPGSAYGTTAFNYPTTFPASGTWSTRFYACSRPGVIPTRYVSWFQASQACALAGKRLPTMAEWQTAVAGTPDPGANDGTLNRSCNTLATRTRPTGNATGCRSNWGAEDMIGNVWEWVGLWVMEPGFNGQVSEWAHHPDYHGDGYYRGGRHNGPAHATDGSYETADHNNGRLELPAAPIMGGSYLGGTESGAFAIGLGYAPTLEGEISGPVGFRCARSR